MDNIFGTWRLISLTHVTSTGDREYPFGKQPFGYLIYAKEQLVSVQIAAENRQLFRSDGLFDGSAEEKAVAMTTFTSYVGRFSVEKNEVVHSIEISLFPNWVGKEQRREFVLTGDKLILKTPEFVVRGVSQRAVLEWQRVLSS
jgi:hypothetical protein